MVFIIYLLLFCLLAHPALSLRFVIENKECIQKSVEAGDKVTGSFVVIDYDSPWRDDEPILDLDVSVALVLFISYESNSGCIWPDYFPPRRINPLSKEPR